MLVKNIKMNNLTNALTTVAPVIGLLNHKENLVGNKKEELGNDFWVSFTISFIIIIIFQILPVMLIAVHCNPKSPVTYGIIAFLFPGIYLFQHAVRKYLMKEKGYCGN